MAHDEYTAKEMAWCHSVLKKIDLRMRQHMNYFMPTDITALRMAMDVVLEKSKEKEVK